MAGGPAEPDLSHQLNTLFQLGVVGDLSDGQLLRRYLAGAGGASHAAFAALVGRHGPMVLGVCRQVLGDSHDADDAFQATFLVLARRAGAVRKADSLASWLHGVALRCAARARADASRRRVHERRGAEMKAAETEADAEGPEAESWPELHEEIARLPGRFREPVVLCYLEGLTAEEAAARLGCPRGTVLSRLSRARDRLRARLIRRGAAPLQAAAWITGRPLAPVPEPLVAAATALAAADLGGRLIAGAVPASVFTLSTGVLHAMILARLKPVALAMAATVLIGMAGAGVYAFQDRDEAPTPGATAATRPGPTTEAPVADPVPTQELAVQLALARQKLTGLQRLAGTRAISQSTVNEGEGEVLIIEARIAGRVEQLEEELELLKVRLEGKVAEKRIGPSSPARSAALTTEVREIQVRIKYVERRLAALRRLQKDAKPEPDADPPPVPGASRVPLAK